MSKGKGNQIGHTYAARRERFVTEYLKDLNARQAAIRAGYSARSARVTSSKLLAKADVQDIIQRRLTRMVDRQEFTADQVLQEAAKIAFSDIRQLFHADGKLKEPHELDEATARAVASYRRYPDGRVDVKLAPKEKGLELLAKYYGLLRERVELVTVDPARLAALPPEEFSRLKEAALAAQRLLADLGGG